MADIRVECTACRAHYLVDADEMNAGKLGCLKCGAQTFRQLCGERTGDTKSQAPVQQHAKPRHDG